MAELQKNALMKRIQQACFAAHECALYLDGHPYNRKALILHARYVKEAEDLKAAYESTYGPLTADAASRNALNDNGKTRGWSWTVDKWPWQNMED